jgi:hypothetical protein
MECNVLFILCIVLEVSPLVKDWLVRYAMV